MSSRVVYQGILENSLRSIFSGTSGIRNSRTELKLKHPHTGVSLEVDVWYPDLDLCFEYQDEYHYQSIWYCQNSLSIVRQTDEIKRNLILQRGQTYIIIPCWWDGTLDSLRGTISFHRPDLLFETYSHEMIPVNPPVNFFQEDMKLMLVSFATSVHLVDATKDDQWWIGEKYDGVRCCWIPNDHQLYSRHGQIIDVPPSVKSSFPRTSLDGEIWCGRGLFLETNFLIQADLEKPNWALFRIICFDEASREVVNLTYEQRYSHILSVFPPNHPTTIVSPRLLNNSAAVPAFLIQVMEEGGEGVILQKPFSVYQLGERSIDLIKLKGAREDDQEALVVDVEQDGSLLLQMPDGVQFTVPKSDCILHRRVFIGDVVSFSSNPTSLRSLAARNAASMRTRDEDAELRSAPARPVVHRVREDLAWEDVLRSSSLPTRHFFNEPHQRIKNFITTNTKTKNWNEAKDAQVVREILETIAKEKKLDPLLSTTWYLIPQHECMHHWSVRYYMEQHHGGNWAKAVVSLFPELNLDVDQFHASRKFTDNVQNRRTIFEKFARTKGGNPLAPSFWYSHNLDAKKQKEIQKNLMRHYSGSLYKALVHLYPEMDLDIHKFEFSWQSKAKRRKVFDDFAKSKNFNPLVPGNWYPVSSDEFSAFQDGYSLLRFYSMSFVRAVTDVYDECKFLSHKFHFVPKRYWQDVSNRRKWFDVYAAERSFDPLVEENWYSVTSVQIKAAKGGKEVLRHHGFSLIKALSELYPTLRLQVSEFSTTPVNFWKDATNRRKWFDKFAESRGFDPLLADNWYNTSAADVHYAKGGKGVIDYHGTSFARAVADLYPELHLQVSKFANKPRDYFQKASNGRKWVDQLTRENSIDSFPTLSSDLHLFQPNIDNYGQQLQL